MTDTAKQATNANATSNKQSTGGKLKGPELLKAVQKQIEFYLSRENLQNDAYLVQQMDASLYVAVQVIASFPKIASLTKDIKVVVKAIKNSKEVQLNGDQTLVKPDITMERNTIILRDVSPDASKEDVIALFKEYDAKAVNVRSDINDVWFVQMESEDAARTVLLKMMGKKFKGKPIRGGLKTESLLRSVTPKAGASPKNALSDGGSNNPSNMPGRNNAQGGNGGNMYSQQPPPQNMGMPQMFPPMQNGMPPMYGYMNGMPQMPPAPYMNGAIAYQPYMNAPHMYNPRFMQQGQQQGNQKGGKQNRGNRGNANQGAYQYQQANGYTGRNTGRGNQMHMGRGPRGNRGNNNFRGNNNYYNNQQHSNSGHNMNNANQHNNHSSHQSSNHNSQHNNKNHKVDNNSSSKGNKNNQNNNTSSNNTDDNKNSSNSGNNSNSNRKSKKNRSKSDKNSDNNNSGNNSSKSSKDKSKKDSKDNNSKSRRNSKSKRDANINVNSASDFPSLGGSSKPVSTKWGKGDASAIKRAPEQEASDAKKEAFARLKTNVNEGNAKKVVSNVIDNAVAQSSSKKSAGNNNNTNKNSNSKTKSKDNKNNSKNQQNNTESKQPVGDSKVFSWAATVAKTANVPVKPVVSKSSGKNNDGGDKKKKKSEKQGEKQGSKQGVSNSSGKQNSVSKSPGSSPNRNTQTGDSNTSKGTNENSIKPTPTITSAPAPRRGWERPELTKEREKLLKEKAQRDSSSSTDVTQGDSQQKAGSKRSKKKVGDSDKGNNKKASTGSNNKNKDSKNSTSEISTANKGSSNVNATVVDEQQKERGISNSKPTFAEMLRKKQQAQQNKDTANSPGERGINQNVKNSRASAFAEATGAQSSFNAEKPEREFVRSDLQ
jgi:hypothetical protein